MSSTTTTTFSFPQPELTRIEGVPSYLSVQNLKRELFTNAASVHSTRGSGTHGHAVLVLGDVEYNRIANLPAGGNAHNWTNPVHPGNQPVIPVGATQAQIASLTAQYERDLKEFTTFTDIKNALKRQLLGAVNSTYVCSLQDPFYGYANVSVRDLLTHLETTYAQLDQDQLTTNMEMLKVPWEPSESMEPLWQRAVNAQQVAHAGNDPITDTTLLRIFRKVIGDRGLFELDLRDWDKKEPADQTWDNFKTHFTNANKERMKKTTAGQLQHHAFAAISAPTSRAGTPTTTATLPLTSPITTDGSLTGLFYCWSHGLGNNPDHTSRTCTHKATGHQEDATVENMLGGNNTIRRKRNERNKFRQLNPPTPRNDAANSATSTTDDAGR